MSHCHLAAVSALLATLSPQSATSQAPPEFKLRANDAAAEDWFGRLVALSGDTALVGAHRDLAEAGSAYVFIRDGARWIQQAKLTAHDAAPSDNFGARIALDRDTALVGAFHDDDDGSSSGSAYVFVRDGSDWVQQAKLTASDAAAGDWFGLSVALSGNTALVGAYRDDDAGSNSGSAYVFVREGTNWVQEAKLTAIDADAGDSFGWFVAMSGDRSLVGAPDDDSTGSAYVFVRRGTSWTQEAKLTASDARSGDEFGGSVAFYDDTALVGAEGDFADGGSAYVFVHDGTSWTQQTKLAADDRATKDRFGHYVALSADTALVGAYRDDDAGTDSGSAYVFVRSGTSWTQRAKLTASDAAEEDWFGVSVGLSGDTALVGAYRDDDAGNSSGSAYVYDLDLARVNEFGTGCPGMLAAPVLDTTGNSLPTPGNSLVVVLSGMTAGNPAGLILGLSNTQWLSMTLPMSLAPYGTPECSLLVSGDYYARVPNTTGTSTQNVPIPSDPGLLGLHIYFQGVVLDPGASPFGLILSNGLDVRIGSR